MDSLKTSDLVALQLLMSDELYHIKSDVGEAPAATEVLGHEREKVEIKADVPAIPAIPIETAKKEQYTFFDYLGENNKYTLVLVNEGSHPIIAPKELETLTNILKGKKQEIKDVAIVNLHHYPGATFEQLKTFFACNSIVTFGINPAVLGILNIPANQITTHNATKILATFTIAEMLTSVDKKRVFWEEMKKL
jgi:hypothetical protein